MFKLLNALKRAFVFLLALLATYLTYNLIVTKFLGRGLESTPGILLLWLFTAYVVLPRIHRRLVKLYLPDYFIGRARTGDGLLGDPVNLAVIGSKTQLIKAMKAAGWIEADPLNFRTSLATAISVLTRQSYPAAPVSSLYLFGNKQDLAFQQEVDNNPHKRHHVRFWKTPNAWWLPGGYVADWLGAATYDRRVGISAFTLQLTHKIEADVDAERDYLISTLMGADRVKKVHIAEHYASGFRSRNGGGDHITTDGNLPFLTLVKN